MPRLIKSLDGFSMIELLITFIVLVILAAAAIPAYLDYMRRLDYSEILVDLPKFKTTVENCYHESKTFKGCNGGKHHIPDNVTKPKDAMASIITLDGVITVAPVEKDGLHSTDTYVATPKAVNGAIEWSSSGGGVTNGYAN